MRINGFTIIELVIVIVLLGIMAMAVSITLTPSSSIRLDTAAKRVAADLRYAKSTAFSYSKWYGVTFQTDPTNTYTVFQTNGTMDATIKDPASLGNNFIVNIPALYGGVTLSSVNIAGGSKVEFNPVGTPYNDKNGTAISSAGAITLQYLGNTKTIYITPNTGYISIQ
jgi:prepilin-type N-terminal cleavage/methylation domain-containing protein